MYLKLDLAAEIMDKEFSKRRWIWQIPLRRKQIYFKLRCEVSDQTFGANVVLERV